MRPMPFVFPAGLIFWIVFVWAFTRESRIVRRAMRENRQHRQADAGSLQLIAIGQGVGIFVAFWLAFKEPQYHLSAIPSYSAGLAALLLGAALRRHCFRMLGTSFTGNVTARAEQQVIERGAYRWIRHPSYLAATIMFVGVGLALGNLLSLAVLVLTCVVVYGYRVRVEEHALLRTIGQPYREYMARTRRFIPFVL